MERRSRSDVLRNGLVSVFLRTLEYYPGLLFLTTNRVGEIDEAFKYRVHLSLYYPALDLDATCQIWKNNIARMKQQNKDLEVDQAGLLNYARQVYQQQRRRSWNGREIRNAFQSALALANFNHALGTTLRLTPEHFQQIAQSNEIFENTLHQVHDLPMEALRSSKSPTILTPSRDPESTEDERSSNNGDDQASVPMSDFRQVLNNMRFGGYEQNRTRTPTLHSPSRIPVPSSRPNSRRQSRYASPKPMSDTFSQIRSDKVQHRQPVPWNSSMYHAASLSVPNQYQGWSQGEYAPQYPMWPPYMNAPMMVPPHLAYGMQPPPWFNGGPEPAPSRSPGILHDSAASSRAGHARHDRSTSNVPQQSANPPNVPFWEY